MQNIVRGFNHQNDSEKVFKLYEKTVGNHWPLERDDFFKIINDHYEEGNALIELENNEVSSFISAQIVPQKTASIVIFLHQNKKPTNNLLNSLIGYFKNKRVKKVQLGGGGYSYFWPGIPSNELDLLEFFKQNNFEFTETSIDLTQDLRNYDTPLDIKQRIADLDIIFRLSKRQDKENILKFEKKYFPDWYRYYESITKTNEFEDILIVSDRQNNIIGTVLLSNKNSKSKGNFWIWRKLLGINSGAFGAIGVHPEMRSKGIGLALAGKATEMLKERGVEVSYIGWTWLIDWYGKLGYKVWREYQMSWREI